MLAPQRAEGLGRSGRIEVNGIGLDGEQRNRSSARARSASAGTPGDRGAAGPLNRNMPTTAPKAAKSTASSNVTGIENSNAKSGLPATTSG